MIKTAWAATLRVTLVYAVFAWLWILYSDMAVEAMFDNPKDITRLQTYKGGLFVAITALLLFIMVLRNFQKVERAYQLDGLTGLLNHHMFQEQLDRRLSLLQPGQRLVVGYLDIVRFKELNQAIGFDRADQFLIRLADEIQNHAWRTAIIGRLPPDQFAIAHEFEAGASINQYLYDFQALFDRVANKMGIEARCVIGVSASPEDGEHARNLMSAAAGALALAKSSGRMVQYHDRSLSEQNCRRRKMVKALKQAIADQSLSLVYQPKYVLATGEVSGVEVLLRWKHPEGGFISPAEFIPLAEEYGLMHAISTFVVERAAQELSNSGLLGSTLKHVSINISATEFNEPEGMDQLMGCIRSYPVLLPYIRIEITETATLTDMQQSIQITQKLRDVGMGISIDDFGTGYTSLAMLKDFPVDEIKIDRSFVSGLQTDDRSQTIVSAVIAMANSFDINVVAEGVETGAQLEHLRVMGCIEVQGFLLGVPMSLPELKQHLGGAVPS